MAWSSGASRREAESSVRVQRSLHPWRCALWLVYKLDYAKVRVFELSKRWSDRDGANRHGEDTQVNNALYKLR